MFLFRKFSLWAAVLGMVAVSWVVYRTSYAEPIPDPAFAPSRKPGPSGIAASGIVESLHQDTRVDAPTAGIVMSVPVAIWDPVSAGDPLYVLDDREARASVLAQAAEVAAQQAVVADAERELARTEPLRGSGAVSDEEADANRSNLAIQQAKLDAAQAQLQRLETILDRLTVRAPIDGTVLQINARVGEYVAPGAAEAPALIGAIETLQIRAQVDEQLAPKVRPGVAATGYLKGDTQNPIALEFSGIEPYVRPKRSLTGFSSERVDTRVLEVLFTFPNPKDRSVYVGQQIDLFIALP